MSSFSSFAHSNRWFFGGFCSGGRGQDMKYDRERSRGRGGSGSKDKIDALGRLLTRILRHMATELNLNMRSDGYVKVEDLLKLNMRAFANIPLRSQTVDDIKEAVRKDNKQRFSLLEENGELLIRANQGHTVMTVQSERLLKQILSADEVQFCVHGTYKRNLESILESGLKRMKRLHVHFSSGLLTDGEVISGMRRDVTVLIYLDVRKALEAKQVVLFLLIWMPDKETVHSMVQDTHYLLNSPPYAQLSGQGPLNHNRYNLVTHFNYK
ncbi:uncharacterized protein LOC105765757 isoform X3 [Gossypium raimondii]|uniref:uncharacterized protein LOC105765757 isoform X3 n=1 Tax=Gossypium raimondii TaxID=29730 RepID=UPI00227B910C|nr:uncharacterized protein LOC105765757 isoform X3 [Gossypium raimondii]